MTESKPAPPDGLGPAGLRLWNAILAPYDLDEHELALLVEAARTVDLCASLDERIRQDGPLVESPQGLKAHPAAVEARQQRIALARLLAALRMPSGDQADQNRRPQRRAGVRGTYQVGNPTP